MIDTTADLYVDYLQYMGDPFLTEVYSGKNGTPKTVTELQDSSAYLIEESVPGDSILTILPGTKILNDEENYDQRKKSVFLIGNRPIFSGR
jgi:hypothetical protein